MEKITDLLGRNFQLTQEQLQQRERMIQRVLTDPKACQLLEEYGIPLFMAEKYPTTICRWLEKRMVCETCSGLECCRNAHSGSRETLEMINANIVGLGPLEACSYKKKAQKNVSHRKYYRLCHLAPQDLQIDFAKIHKGLESEPVQYANTAMAVMSSKFSGKGMYLYGEVGAGKSYLAKAAANMAAKEKRSVCFVHVPALIQDLKNNMRDQAYHQKTISALKNSDLVVLDDIGAELISRWTVNEILLPVLDARMNADRETWFTSNFALQDLQKRYGEETGNSLDGMRLTDRIYCLANQRLIPGKSRRRCKS